MKSRNTSVFYTFSNHTYYDNRYMYACVFFYLILVCTDYYSIIKAVCAMKTYLIQVKTTCFRAINRLIFQWSMYTYRFDRRHLFAYHRVSEFSKTCKMCNLRLMEFCANGNRFFFKQIKFICIEPRITTFSNKRLEYHFWNHN